MRWPPNHAWTSARKRGGYRHFQVKQFGGKGNRRWIEVSSLLNKNFLIRVPWSELVEGKEWNCGWLQIPEELDSSDA